MKSDVSCGQKMFENHCSKVVVFNLFWSTAFLILKIKLTAPLQIMIIIKIQKNKYTVYNYYIPIYFIYTIYSIFYVYLIIHCLVGRRSFDNKQRRSWKPWCTGIKTTDVDIYYHKCIIVRTSQRYQPCVRLPLVLFWAF